MMEHPDGLKAPIAAFAFVLDVSCFDHGPHAHDKGQLIYSRTGMLSVETAQSLWVPPARSAVWIPGGTEHRTIGVGQLDLTLLFVEATLLPLPSDRSCIVALSPIVEGLILRLVELSSGSPGDCGRQMRILAVLSDELSALNLQPTCFPKPSDRRLLRLAEQVLAEPSLRLPIEEWGRRAGMTSKTLTRRFQAETGLSFVCWRRELHLSLARQRLRAGDSVTAVAIDLGYESTSAFIAMFKRCTGSTPSRFARQ